ncbi:MAG: hypothetical protein KVP17_003424 [Porospora cf. gigantea B]|uniref:uncharacterized protein n=1 Tax=Porospora cf. gigantea B TaxID=2853592 RepID=UPI003571AD5E|nr:MAG: hypothetical protein KVP17_003424 [Porospora cf. gigantea B]
MLRITPTTASVKQACVTLLGSGTISANTHECLQPVNEATGSQSGTIGGRRSFNWPGTAVNWPGTAVNWPGTAVKRMEVSFGDECELPGYLTDLLVGLGSPNIPTSLQRGVEPSLLVRDVLGLDCLRFPTPESLEYAVQYARSAAKAVLGPMLADTIMVDVSVSPDVGSNVSETFLCALLQLMLVAADIEERFCQMQVALYPNSCSVTLINDTGTPISCSKQHQPRFGGPHEAKIRILKSLNTDYQMLQSIYMLERRRPNLSVSPAESSIADPQILPSTHSAVKILDIQSSYGDPQIRPNTHSTASAVESPVKSTVKEVKSSIKNVKQAQLPRRRTSLPNRSQSSHLSSTGSTRAKQARRQTYAPRIMKLSDKLYQELRRKIIPTHHHSYLPTHEQMLECASSLESLVDPTSAFRDAARRAYLKTQQTRCVVREKAEVFYQQLTNEVSSEIKSL